MADEVDLILAAWARELPDVDVSPLGSLSRISRLARHLDRARSAAFAAHELEVWEFDVLTALRRAGHPYELSPGELVRCTVVSSDGYDLIAQPTDELERKVALKVMR